VRERFEVIYAMAKDGFCDGWMQDADGYLALCLILDQFPRNMFRHQAQAFATDAKALIVAKQAVSKGFDQVLAPVKRRFIYMPFEHSENLDDQKRNVEFFAAMKDDEPLGYEYALRHMRIIERFDRFPHRNKALGRMNTPEEIEYLAELDRSF
jgi:uncharacterized protein (DUF924 family)